MTTYASQRLLYRSYDSVQASLGMFLADKLRNKSPSSAAILFCCKKMMLPVNFNGRVTGAPKLP